VPFIADYSLTATLVPGVILFRDIKVENYFSEEKGNTNKVYGKFKVKS
jgi:hypothetical protein